MKIVLVHCHYQQPGGEDVVFEQERRLLERAGHQVILFIRSNEGLDGFSSVQRLVLIKRAIWNDNIYREFGELLRNEKPDVVHVHNTWVEISPSIYAACRNASVPVIQTHHNYQLLCPAGTFFRDGAPCEECLDHSLWRSVRYACYRESRGTTAAKALMLTLHRRRHTWDRDINRHIVLTEFAKSKFLRGGLPAEKVIIKPNFVYPDPLSLTGNGTGNGAGEKYAVFAGRLAPKKRVTTILSAWRRLRRRIPLVIVGGGPELAELEQEAAKDTLSKITFRGMLPHDETLAAMRGARFLIFSSEWYETFGLTMVEAFACGIPVICSRVGTMQEIVEDGRTGLHFNPGDSEDLAAKVEWALDHPEQMQQMGEEGRREYERKYTAERNYPQLMNIYQGAIVEARS